MAYGSTEDEAISNWNEENPIKLWLRNMKNNP
jgi:hypothetical protein